MTITAYLEKRPGKNGDRWRVQVRHPGGPEPRYNSRTMSQEEAVAFRDRLLAGEESAPSLTVDAFYDRFAKKDIFVGMRANTALTYEIHWRKRVQPAFGHMRLADIKRSHVDEWLKALGDSGLSIRKQSFYTLNKILVFAVAKEVLPANPAHGAFSSKGSRPAPVRVRVVPEPTIARIAADLPDRYKAMIYAMAHGGLRYSEAAGLTVENVIVNKDGLVDIRIEQALTRVGGESMISVPKSRAGYRTIPLGSVASKIFVHHLAVYRPTGLMFTLENGSPVQYSNFRTRYWQPTVELLELGRVTMHDLRHTAVSLWIDHGSNQKQIQTWAGHHSAAFTYDVYGHLLEKGSRSMPVEPDDEPSKP